MAWLNEVLAMAVPVQQFLERLAQSGLMTAEEARYLTEGEKDGTGAFGTDPSTKQWGRRPGFTWRSPGFPQNDEHPVVAVSWNDAVAFCEWLTRKEGKKYRLPTEAEWEYACRAGSSSRYCFGDDPKGLRDYAWTAENSDRKSHPVGQKRPNGWGIYDMHGNVWEWCADWYDTKYYGTALSPNDPPGASSGSMRVLRGGSWSHALSFARSANRDWSNPVNCSFGIGFRVAGAP
jgi:formylglycine-generating enzyme required for sulfatase activity